MKNFYENWKNSPEGQRKLARWVEDPDGLLTGNGRIAGVYEIAFVDSRTGREISAYIGQAGYVHEGILQQLKRWLGNNCLTYWTGLDDTNGWKIRLSLLAEEESHTKRLALESKFIAEKLPFLQDSQNGRFILYSSKYGYSRNDLCIHPWGGQRKRALEYRLACIKQAT